MSATDLELRKMILKATLISNLELLKEKMPAVYKTFKNFEVKDTGVTLDDMGDVNLYNNGHFSYKEPAIQQAKKQVELFLHEPSFYHYEIGHQSDESIIFKHTALLKSIYNTRHAAKGSCLPTPTKEERLDFVCFFGAGLGYQIEALINKKNILNVFLFEPNEACFYAMLHCIELRPLFDSCSAQGGSFSICVGGDGHNAVNEISTLLNKHGVFNASMIYFFKHYDSPLMDKVVEKVRELSHRWHAGWGFFEDEIIGISHTFANLNAQFPIVKKPYLFQNSIAETPVFIAANGPSLDSALDFIKKNQLNIIIVSCGTALKALLANDIKPDLHVEMERTAGLFDWVQVVERDKSLRYKLSDLKIIALNTVFDGILKSFKSAYLLPKVNDAGGALLNSIDSQSYNFPYFSNPSVSNTAMAAVVELGFKNIYLAGTDFGFISQNEHHSKYSIYYDKDFKYNKTVDESMESDIEVKGNFREKVLSIQVFDSSKGNIELLLQGKPEVKVYNTSDGAFIQFTEPKRIDDITISKKIPDKQRELDSLLKVATQPLSDYIQLKSKGEELEAKVRYHLEQLLMLTSRTFSSREELANVFFVQHKMLLALKNNPNEQAVYWLIQGTFKYFQTYILSNSYYYELKERAEFINACVNVFHEHINDIFIEFIEIYNKKAKV